MRASTVCLVALVALVACSLSVSARTLGTLQAATSAPVLTKARVSTSVGAAPRAKLDISGKFWYLDRDRKLPHLPATLVCTGGCATATPTYRATLTKVDAVVFGNLQINSNYVGFGSGPAPAIVGGCPLNNFTVILENERAVGNIFAAYSPCGTSFEGGASIYAKNKDSFLASLKNDLMNDVRIWTQVPPRTAAGKYTLHDRNVASVAEPLSISCIKDCENSKTPTYKGVFGAQSFTVRFAPDGYVGFGTLDVLQAGRFCGRTQFTLIVPPKGLASKAAFLAAARPLPECQYAGQAIRIE